MKVYEPHFSPDHFRNQALSLTGCKNSWHPATTNRRENQRDDI